MEGLRTRSFRHPSEQRLRIIYNIAVDFEEGVKLFRKAIEKQTWKNPNPYHGECYFNLGLALHMAGKLDEAYDAFYKATWSYETQSSGFYWLAALSCGRGNYKAALKFIEQSMIRNWHNMKARTLKAAILRTLGQDRSDFLDEIWHIDPLDMGIRYEKAVSCLSAITGNDHETTGAQLFRTVFRLCKSRLLRGCFGDSQLLQDGISDDWLLSGLYS